MVLSRKLPLLILILILGAIIAPMGISAQSEEGTTPESLPITVPADSTVTDTTNRKKDKTQLDAPIDYTAKDSLVIEGDNIAFLFGQSTVKYQDINLDADEIEMKLDSSLVYANGRPDSTGFLIGKPIFKDKSGEYKSTTLSYSFKTGKGYITNLVTQQGEGYLTGGQTKKMENNEFYIKNGKYSTCDHHDCPHFYLELTKGKVKPGDEVIMGPSYLVMLDVPIPFIGVPFGFFPFNEKYSSGIIMPTFGDEMNRGFYLSNGGYYFAINDNIDLALTGEIYTKGSWGLNARSAYVRRYKYSGSFDLGYLVTITGDKGMPDYSKQTNFQAQWTHTQDPKANPNMNFSASVNFSTSGYNRNDLGGYYNPNDFTENTKSSTVSLSYNFPNSPFSIATTANITQRSSDSTLVVSLPNITLNMSRIYPFRRKIMIGKERWYEKISMNYSAQFRNSIETKQDDFFKKSLIRDWRNGMQHNIPISATFSLFKYINLSPSFNFTDRMYSSKIMQEWDTQNSTVKADTAYGFYNVYNFNFSLSAQTKLYGFYKPWKIFGDGIQMIRHVFTPSLTFSAAPDFSDPMFGSWSSYTSYDAQGNAKIVKYSPFSRGIFGTAPRGKQGTLSLNLGNNLEMKVKSNSDTTGYKKISLIESLSGGISYNMAADSMNWSNINASILLRITQGFNLQLSGTFDTYTYKLNREGNPIRVNIPRWQAGKGLGRLSSTGTSFSYTFNNDTFKPKKKKTSSENTESNSQNPEDSKEETPIDAKNCNVCTDPYGCVELVDGYMAWSIPWSLGINYSVNLGYGTFNKKKLEYDYRITQNLSFSGSIQPTKNWSINLSASYDFNLKKIAYMNCNITRDLHCWTMGASFIPVGPYKSYTFNVAVKASILKDLKIDKRSNPYDNIIW